MYELRVFEHSHFGSISVVCNNDGSYFKDDKGELWFVAMDIAKALGYAKPHEAVRDHCEKVNKITQQAETGRSALNDPPRNILIIPESDVYALIFSSKLPAAKEFKRWVCEEVLPSIRKTGKYDMTQDSKTDNSSVNVDLAVRILELAGLKGNQLTLACDKIHKRLTNNSALEMAGIILKAPVQEQKYIPTEIGLLLNPEQSPRYVNKVLKTLGLQIHDDKNGKWVLTETGLSHGEYGDTGKKHSNGTPVLQIHWNESVVKLVQDYLKNSQ